MADYRAVPSAVLLCALIAQGLSVAPVPATCGHPVEVRASRGGAPLAAVAVSVEQPDGATVSAGVTDSDGRVAWTPQQSGGHVFAAQVEGVRVIVSLPVLPERANWPFAVASVPLGLALLWSLTRARGRRAP